MVTVRERLKALSGAENDAAAIHALLAWLDSLPPAVLIAAEGRCRAGVGRAVSGALPKFDPNRDAELTTERQVEASAQLARVYWEHPALVYAGIPEAATHGD